MEKSREYECFQAGSLPFPHVISTNFFLYTANSIIVFFWNPQILKLGPFGLGRGGLLHLGPKIARRSSPFSPSSPVLSSTDHRLSPGTADGPANPEAHPPLLPRSPVGVTAPGRCLAWSADPSRVQTDCFSPRW